MKTAAIALVRWMSVHPVVAIGAGLLVGVWLGVVRLGLAELQEKARFELALFDVDDERWMRLLSRVALLLVLASRLVALLLFWADVLAFGFAGAELIAGGRV